MLVIVCNKGGTILITMATLTDSLEDISNFNNKHGMIHKRTRRDSDSGAENDLVVHSLKVKRVKSAGTRRQSFIVKSKEMKAYFRLLGKWITPRQSLAPARERRAESVA